jgi:deazaflavin-dependent oxidoreductase (nitroreductase family)
MHPEAVRGRMWPIRSNAAWCGTDLGDTTGMPVHSFDDANVFHRAMRAVAATKAGRVLFRPTAHRLDQLVSKLTGGKRSFAGIAAGLPSVILTTTGAKSGKPRTVALLGIPHPDGVAVVAANYGDAKHPAWSHNLKANPAATVVIEGDNWDANARLAAPREREEIWTKGVKIYPGLTKEQVWAGDRHIEAFVLERK